ncbi:LysE family translocator [uncultured Cohaesibacter sp.]|uniref:LysE family translocator n=1 Tax=uncultured Cohaesibacter sp. TaxID=1002546 RepID=UPI0029C86869|nr:LysE family translocator [uncultured Cohaesibacter sp.]
MLIPFDTLALFLAASLALGVAPGPDNIFVLTQSALFGRRAGLLVTLGLCTGLLVHTAAVTFGIAVLFQTSELAFNGLKFAGAAYLLYLAWGAFRARGTDLDGEAGAGTGISPLALYGRGIVMNVTNPKVAIFFLAFLPQFADPARGSLSLQLFLFGLLFILATIVVFSLIAFGAGALGGWLRASSRAQVIMNRIAGLVFVALAARLMMAQR